MVALALLVGCGERCTECEDPACDDDTAGDDDEAGDDDAVDDDSATVEEVAMEARGAWLWASVFGNEPESAIPAIEQRVNELTSLGINLMFPVVKADRAYYPSSVTGVYDGWDAYDLIETFASATATASPDGRVEVHPWTCVFRTGSLLEEHPEYASVNREGTASESFACPSRPEVRAQAIAVIQEIFDNYAVPGIHLDYVRFAGSQYCYCERCRSDFEAQYGTDPLMLPSDHQDWIEFRASQVTTFVQQVRSVADTFDPPRLVSAAVFNKPHDTEGDPAMLGQNWKLWLDEGLLDFVVPMNYSADPGEFVSQTQTALLGNDPAHHIYMGVGLYLFEEGERDEAVDQLEMARILEADGAVIFRAEYIDEQFVEAVQKLWSTPATLPHAAEER